MCPTPGTWKPRERWAEALSERSFGGQAFFCNSGTEANEAAIKLARLHTPKQRYKIITFEGGFHGRTLGSTTATAQPKYHEGLGPLMAGFRLCPLRRSGRRGPTGRRRDGRHPGRAGPGRRRQSGFRPRDFWPDCENCADENELLLIFDEVQTGCGRTGEWFGYQGFDVTPDVMTLAKAICGGLAGGAMLTTAEIAPSLRPGNARGHVRRQSDRRPGRCGDDRNASRRTIFLEATKRLRRVVPPSARTTPAGVRLDPRGPRPGVDDSGST